MSKINWRSIKEVGHPTDANLTYLVSDGRDISTTNMSAKIIVKEGKIIESKFVRWTGDENTWEDNPCCSGERMFDMDRGVTHWCPTNEINLPK